MPQTPFQDDLGLMNNLAIAVEAIEQELGLLPSGVYSTVRVRLDILEARINNPLAPSPTVTNPFTIGLSGVTLESGFGVPTQSRTPGSLFLREDGYVDQGLYAYRPDGQWHIINTDQATFAGDLSGSITTQTVVGIQNNLVKSGILSSNQDGYALLWNNTDQLLEFTQLEIPVQQGGSPKKKVDIDGLGTSNTNASSTTPFVVGAFEFNLLNLQTAGKGARTIEFKCLLETTGPLATIYLYNVTTASIVIGSTLTTSSLTPLYLSSGDLTSVLSNGSAIYQVRMFMATGLTSDRITCTLAKLLPEWS